MRTFLGIGECMVELSPVGSGLWRQSFAGDVLNTLWYARAVLRENWLVQFHSAVGMDPVSNDMLRFIETAGISCANMPRIEDRHPGLYTINLDKGERSFNYWRDTSAARLMLHDPQILWKKIKVADIVYLSGITLAILPPVDAEALLHGIEKRIKPGAILAFDPNIRAQLWDDPGRMRKLISRAGGMAEIVFPSFRDEQLSFGDVSSEATAERYLELGASQVVVKNGVNPTLVANGEIRREFPVPTGFDVVDTTAAGDSFAGAYLAKLATTGSIAECVETAQACAALVVSHNGALVPHKLLRGEEA